MKYIIFKEGDELRCVRFAPPIAHSDMVEALRPCGYRPRSAGFVEFIERDRVRCFGRSESLGIGTDPHDESIIEIFTRAAMRVCPDYHPAPPATLSTQPMHI